VVDDPGVIEKTGPGQRRWELPLLLFRLAPVTNGAKRRQAIRSVAIELILPQIRTVFVVDVLDRLHS
jgi:hypothetical protein